ncbi:unnamed protein product [Toxocara canis]|uniref:Tyrosine-protein phosphatase non-receptor type 12 n=1 Tax=Toxocara canis TaxID=6265 RepID=A0A183UY46_TOXCA|nr:unnamed protein product [Toxocara canis]
MEGGRAGPCALRNGAHGVIKRIVAMVNFAEKISKMSIDDFKRLFRKIQARGSYPNNLSKRAYDQNVVKCRYNDIVCLDDTRVVLKPMPKFNGDFIHASETRKVRHFHWKGWPDRLAPRHLITPYTLHGISNTVKWPTVVHCSAGVGRTGTFVMLEILYRCLRAGKERPVTSLLWDLRSQRAGAVQTFDQFLFIYYSTLQRLISRGVVDPASVTKFCKDYEARFMKKTGKVPIEWPKPVRRIVVDPELLKRAVAFRNTKKSTRRHMKVQLVLINKKEEQSCEQVSQDKLGKAGYSKRVFEMIRHPSNSKRNVESSLKEPKSEPRSDECDAEKMPKVKTPSIPQSGTKNGKISENLLAKKDRKAILTKPLVTSINPQTEATSGFKKNVQPSKEVTEEIAEDDVKSPNVALQSPSKGQLQAPREEVYLFKELQPTKEGLISSKKEAQTPKGKRQSPPEGRNDKGKKLQLVIATKSENLLDELKNVPNGNIAKASSDEPKNKLPTQNQPIPSRPMPEMDILRDANLCDTEFVEQDMARFNVKKEEQRPEARKEVDINLSPDDMKDEDFCVGIQKEGVANFTYLSHLPNKSAD